MAKCGFSLSSERILPGVFIGVFIGVFAGVFTGVFNGLDSARSAPLPPNCGGAECFSPQGWGAGGPPEQLLHGLQFIVVKLPPKQIDSCLSPQGEWA